MAAGHQIDGRCVFCGAPASRRGEHVLPSWFLGRWSGEGPFTYEVNGQPVPDRHGNPRKASDLPSEQLPGCLRLFLPETSTPDGQGGEPGTLLDGYRQAGTRMLLVQCILHPLCDCEHPFEQAGLAVRVWQDPPPRLDIACFRYSARGPRSAWCTIRQRQFHGAPTNHPLAYARRGGA
jgi:hypothetical protein